MFIRLSRLRSARASNSANLALLLALLLAMPVSAAQLYRYKDDQGNYVLNQMIPAKYVSKGYDVLNDKGRVIKTVAPALTPEQIIARDAAREKARLAKLEQEKQDAYDNELKQLYSHPNDAVRVLSRRIQDIQGVIQIKRGKIDAIRKNILTEEAKAADRQRRGLSISESTLEQLDKYKGDIVNNEHDIAELHLELDKVKADFDKKIKRLEQFTGKEATDYAALLAPPVKDSADKAETETEATP